MDMKKILLYIIASISIASGMMYGMEADAATDISHYTIHGIPGWTRNAEHSAKYIQQIFPDHSDVQHVIIPPDRFDFAQQLCIDSVQGDLKKKNTTKPIITVAVSLGAATILNVMGEQSRKNEADSYRPAALILTAPFASGNSGMLHLLDGPKEIQVDPFLGPLCKSLLGSRSRDWIPFLAKFMRYWSYDPDGIQPIKSLQHFPKDQLVIFAHYEKDPQVSVNDSKAMYYFLGSQGHKKQYMILKDEKGHGNVLKETDRPLIDSILRQNGLIANSGKAENVDLTPYQPNFADYKEHYDTLIKQEKRYEEIKPSVYVATAAMAGSTAVGCSALIINYLMK
jgi:hypothetical protein